MGTAREYAVCMQRLLVALDTSDESPFVLARAVELASALGAKVRLLSVAQVPPIMPMPALGPIYVEPSGIIDGAEAALRQRENDVPPALRDGIVVELGDVCDAVCSVARSYNADLVVIGAHRHGMLARMIGTTAARIVNHIDRPVIIVRPMPPALEATPPQGAASDASERAPWVGSATVEVDGAMRAGAILRRDHEQLEYTYDDLLAAYRSGDWEEVRKQWNVFEPAIRAHMDTEELDVFPGLRAVDRAEADALLADHTVLRRLLETLSVAIELHAFPAGDADELLARIRSHGAREENLLFPWMDEALDASKLQRLSARRPGAASPPTRSV